MSTYFPTTTEVSAGLRDVADYLDAHPDLPQSTGRPRVQVYCPTASDLATMLHGLSVCDVDAFALGSDSVHVRRPFGWVDLVTVVDPEVLDAVMCGPVRAVRAEVVVS